MRYEACLATPIRCLVAEDQTLIGMALKAYLEDAGYDVAGPFATSSAALAALDTHTPAVAIIDYALKDGCCLVLARVLRDLGVPFLVYSGLPRLPDLNSEFESVSWLEKPTDRPELLKAVANLLSAGGGSDPGLIMAQMPGNAAV
jgi:DNA-binding response OmpR family regulator